MFETLDSYYRGKDVGMSAVINECKFESQTSLFYLYKNSEKKLSQGTWKVTMPCNTCLVRPEKFQVIDVNKGVYCFILKICLEAQATLVHKSLAALVYLNPLLLMAFGYHVFENIMENGAFAHLEQIIHFP